MPPKSGLNSNPDSYQSECGYQDGFQAFSVSFVWLTLAHLVHQERNSLPSDQYVQWHLAGIALLVGWEHWARNKEVQTPLLNTGWAPRNVVGWLRQRDRAPKLSGSKFIKQSSSNSADSSPKTEPQEQRGLSLYINRNWGIVSPMHGHILFHWVF
jgi:hypothetical protein